MKKRIKKILKFLGFSRERHYLKELIKNIQDVYNEQKKITYTIYQIRQRGFIVKVGGLFAFVSFKHMPWRYPNYKYWTLVTKYLVGKRFYCNIHKIKKKPLLILIDGKIHVFKEIEPSQDREYNGVILNKSRYGYHVDIGFDFEWEYGPFLGIIQPSNISDSAALLDEGDQIKVRINRPKIEDQEMDLVDVNIPIEWYDGKIEKLIGTTQKVLVSLNESNRREYIVNGKYKAVTPATKELYGDEKDEVEELLKNMNLDQSIPCVIVAINKESKTLILKILPQDLKSKN